MKLVKSYDSIKLLINEDFSLFAPSYTPENFTDKEKRYLNPFFSNWNKPVFIAKNLPEEVIGALSSRYSRAEKSLRRLFLDEYLEPIISPQKQKNWAELSKKEKEDKNKLKRSFFKYLKFFEKNGGVEEIVNAQRGRAFFDKWLDGYGDDSIAELGGVHLFIEGASNIVVNEMQSQRVGISPLEKSTRYVSFASKRPDGKFQYIIPGEIKNTDLEIKYSKLMDKLFETYVSLAEPYLDYIKKKYPKDVNEPLSAFNRSRSAKRFDDLRELLPFATQTNVAFYGNGRSYEAMINRLLSSQLGESRWWGQQIAHELDLEVPSFVRRPQTERGVQSQLYRHNLVVEKRKLINKYLKISNKILKGIQQPKWATLVDYDTNDEVLVVASLLMNNYLGYSIDQLYKIAKKIGKKKRAQIIEKILNERKFNNKIFNRETDRFRKPPRAFECARYTFALKARGGDYRDLHRHRQLTHERHVLTTNFGYDLDLDVKQSPFLSNIQSVLHDCADLYRLIGRKSSYDIAQYCVPFAFIQTWYMTLSAREIYWIVELRTSPQGRPHYREICQQIAYEVIKVSPAIFSFLLVDKSDYRLSRRESEIKRAQKLNKK